MDGTTERINAFVQKLQESDFLQCLMQAMMSTLPVTIIGSFATLLMNINIPVYQEFLASTGLAELLSTAVICTTNIIALIIAMSMSKSIAAKRGVADATPVGFLGLVVFFILTPLSAETDEYGQVLNFIPMTWLGSTGMFSAIVVGLIVGYTYAFVVARNWTIKMPDSVPAMVSESFSAMIPGIIVGVLALALRTAFAATSYGSMHSFIYGVLQIPLSGLTGNIASLCIVVIVTGVLWFIGVHGAMVTMSAIAPVLMTLDFENQAAVAAGVAPTNTLGFAFYSVATMAGGYIGLQICLSLFTAALHRPHARPYPKTVYFRKFTKNSIL